MPTPATIESVAGFLSLAQLAEIKARNCPTKPAIFLEHESPITFGAVFNEALHLAASLHRLGLRQGDVVSFQLPNWRETAVIDIACCWLGLVINPIIPIYREREVGHILSDCGAKAVFILDQYRNFDHLHMIEGLRSQLPELEHIILVRSEQSVDGVLHYQSLLETSELPPSKVEVQPDDTKLIMYTSGTTGRAKAVHHSHRSLACAILNGVEGWSLDAEDVMLMPSPVTHITGYANGIELPFFSDAKSALMERWNVEDALTYIDRVKATVCVSATPFLQELVEAAENKQLKLPSLRAFACGGASVPPTLITRTAEVLENCQAFRVYGCTEAPLVSVGFIEKDELNLAANTDGRILNWEVLVIDDQGRVLDPGQDGEIVVRGPAMMKGYGEAEQTRLAVDDQGYFHTGDIGHTTAEGAIVITDRKKDIIIRGGENLSAREIEDVLHTHPLIVEAAVVAMPHERLGEGVCAVLVTRDGSQPSLAELQLFLEESKLAKQKWPEKLEYLTQMPKTASGKIKKDILRKKIVPS
ncbi:AMP-binding protein [Aestuariicella hydrocarbonica]|uniref:AMP-binding protein n=1 Tax=Pseudomaricurvus hydrocarbonicus TaxID=1470433 RepID=A0A9E5MLD6_9GAMM|nr:AMP-binding protein [Aestuariicella hydrocarbonica]NHO66847.1 AMP-binding protein [Aestuariicella hydrocarbonica]